MQCWLCCPPYQTVNKEYWRRLKLIKVSKRPSVFLLSADIFHFLSSPFCPSSNHIWFHPQLTNVTLNLYYPNQSKLMQAQIQGFISKSVIIKSFCDTKNYCNFYLPWHTFLSFYSPFFSHSFSFVSSDWSGYLWGYPMFRDSFTF